MSSESYILSCILGYLEHLPACLAWRNNTGGAVIRGRHVSFGSPGSPDILCCYRGAFLGIECKSAVGRQSPIQKRWQQKFEAAGGRYILARSVQDVKSYLEAA
jgi:Holliday junction resolvase